MIIQYIEKTLPSDWDLVEFQDIAHNVMVGIASAATHAYCVSGIPMIRNTNIKAGYIDTTDMLYIDPAYERSHKNKRLKTGDVITVRTGYPGISAVVPVALEGAQCFTSLITRPKIDRITSEYLCEFINSPVGEKQFEIGQAGGAQKNVNVATLCRMVVPLPPIREQQVIIHMLKNWGLAITLTEQLIAAKQERRTWLMLQLLSGKLRVKGFSKKWSRSTLGDLVEPTSRPIAKPTEPYKALGIRSHCKGTFERFVDDPSRVDMEELFVAKEGDLIVNITFAWEGAIAFVPEEHDGHLVSHRFPTYCIKEDEVDHDFLRYVVTQPRFIFMLILISPGGAGRNRVMSKKDFLNIEVAVPCLDEQRKIGENLKLADSEIELLFKKLDALREQKKGLMQQLLTGKRRVKV
jgi:type I restriction enzyme S subunit